MFNRLIFPADPEPRRRSQSAQEIAREGAEVLDKADGVERRRGLTPDDELSRDNVRWGYDY